MGKKWIMLLFIFILTTSLLTGCKDKKEVTEENKNQIMDDGAEESENTQKQEVIVTMPPASEPEAGFDPAYGWGAGEHVHEPLIQSTLTVTTKTLEIAKDLATDYSVSSDKMVWTVKIRDDVKFTDGQPLTAEDVAFTYNNCKKNSSVNDFTMLKKAVVKDATTVEFHMTKPYAIWPYTMATVGIVPKHAYDSNYGQHPIGSGRYILKQWDKGQQVIFEANPDYYGLKVKIKKLTVLFMEEDAAVAAAMAGQVDVAHISASMAEQSIDGYELFRATTVDNRGFNLPAVKEFQKNKMTIGNDVTADVAIRRAINIAIDRQEMIDNVLNGYGTLAYSVCDQMPWFEPDPGYCYDPQKARRILEKAGWVEGKDGIRQKDGVKAEFTLMFPPEDSVRQALAEDTANQLRKIGISVKTEGVGWDEAYDRAQSQALMWGWGAHTPMELYNIYHTQKKAESAQYSPYANKKVDAYMDQALRADNLEQSYGLWKKAQWDGKGGVTQNGDIPWIWLCNVDHLYFVRQGLMIADQKIHPHGHGWSIVNNVDRWEWSK